jgi:DNA-binding YbaB/EbfC family protein
MSMPDLGKLLSGAREMQGKLAELQRELASRRIEGSAGGGMVRVVVNGQQQVLELHIEPGLVEGGDKAMLEDLCAAAVNAALTNAQREAQEAMQQLTGGLGLSIPGFGGLDGLGGSGGSGPSET